jgi:hypothetical protein
VSAVRHNGASFALRCDDCGVETTAVRYGDDFPLGWATEGWETDSDAVLHVCPECRLVGVADTAQERRPFD